MKLYRADRVDAEWTMTADEIALEFVQSRFADAWRGGWPLDRALRVFICASDREGGLDSCFDEVEYPEVFEAVRRALRE